MEKVYTIRVVSYHLEDQEWFEKVHQIRAAEENIAVNWIKRMTEQMNHHLELWRVENIRTVPHFGRAPTDE